MSQPEITVTKAVGYLPYSVELADDYPDVVQALADALDPTKPRPEPWTGPPITPLPELHQRLLHATEGTSLRAVVELHGPHPGYIYPDGTVRTWVCDGCDGGPYDDAADWPCSTVYVIAEQLGIEEGAGAA